MSRLVPGQPEPTGRRGTPLRECQREIKTPLHVGLLWRPRIYIGVALVINIEPNIVSPSRYLFGN
jgi:hypothetical protein